MRDTNNFDVIVVGGSYSGLAAAMALGRALRKVLIIDSGKPCNSSTPHSHNFITQDGVKPEEIAAVAKRQVLEYKTVRYLNGLATKGIKKKGGFEIQTDAGDQFTAERLIFASGIKDIMPEIEGYTECWGISAIHCPYCHGYEFKNAPTGILGNGEYGFEFSALIHNWTKELFLFTNGKANLKPEQTAQLKAHNIPVIEKGIRRLSHTNGSLKSVIFEDGTAMEISALYANNPFVQHCSIPERLGCELMEDGYLKIDDFQETTVKGVYACGDNTTRMRSVANAVSTGAKTGMVLSKELILERF